LPPISIDATSPVTTRIVCVVNYTIYDCGKMLGHVDQQPTHRQLTVTQMHFTAGTDTHSGYPLPTKIGHYLTNRARINSRIGIRNASLAFATALERGIVIDCAIDALIRKPCSDSN